MYSGTPLNRRVSGFGGLERWNGTVEWTGLEWWNGMEWNGGMIEYARDSRLKSQSYCKPYKHHSGHPSTGGGGGGGAHKRGSFYKGVDCVHISTVAYTSSMGVADPSGKLSEVQCRPIVPSGDNYIKNCRETIFSACLSFITRLEYATLIESC